MASAAKKRYPDEDPNIRVSIDRQSGEYETFRRWEIIADDGEMESPFHQLRLMDAIDEREDSQIGEYIQQQIENAEFGRIAAQAAKQVIVQRVREAERQQVVDAFKDRVGELITGIVKRVERGNVYLDLGSNAEAFIPRDKTIPPGCATPSMREATFTPSPIRSSPCTTMSPRWIPMRRGSAGSAFWIATAHATACTALENSTRNPSPTALNSRPACLAICGSMMAVRIDWSCASVPISSPPISFE